MPSANEYDEPLRFVASETGVHLCNPYYMDEGTLCGLGPDNEELTDMDVNAKVVTCPQCIRIIKRLQSVKFKVLE